LLNSRLLASSILSTVARLVKDVLRDTSIAKRSSSRVRICSTFGPQYPVARIPAGINPPMRYLITITIAVAKSNAYHRRCAIEHSDIRLRCQAPPLTAIPIVRSARRDSMAQAPRCRELQKQEAARCDCGFWVKDKVSWSQTTLESRLHNVGGLWQPDTASQVVKTWIAMKVVEIRVRRQEGQSLVMFPIRGQQACERAIFLS